MPKVQCSDKVWRHFINKICQDCMKRVEGDFKVHTCKRLETFPTSFNSTRQAGVPRKQPLEEMTIDSVRMILAGRKFMNYGKKI